MSSNRRILESMLSNETNASRNDPHNSTNARARLARLLEARIQANNADQNTSLAYVMTAVSSDSSVYQFASDQGENLDEIRYRGLLENLDMQRAPASLCREPGDELYYNPDCYPYFRSVFRTRSDDAKQHFSTLLAIFACGANATALTQEQHDAIDEYCSYNESPVRLWEILMPISVVLVFSLAFLYVMYRRQNNRALEANAAAAAPQDPSLTHRLLDDSNAGPTEERPGVAATYAPYRSM
jgi:hypothetical protein